VGTERVVSIDIWRNLVTLQDEQRQRRVVELEALRAEMAAAPPAGPQLPREDAEPEAAPLPTPTQPQRPPRRPRNIPNRRPE
jgi:hypothetical protein